MERAFLTLTIWSTLAFADASHLFASGLEPDEAKIVEVASNVGDGIDFIITGPTTPIKQYGIIPHLDACDADCQANRLGIIFDD